MNYQMMFAKEFIDAIAKHDLHGVATIEANGLLQVLVSPMLEGFDVQWWFYRREIGEFPTLWHDKWWARFLRWVESKWRVSPMWPPWLWELLHAEGWTATRTRHAMPDEALGQIRIQRAHLRTLGIEPTMILAGQGVYYGLIRSYREYTSTCKPDMNGDFQWNLFGLPIQINPFLAENAVVVC